MTGGSVNSLLKEIQFTFGLPLVAFVMFFINVHLWRNKKFIGLMMRLSLCIVLLFFIANVCVLGFQDRDVLAALWRHSRVRDSILYCLCALLIGAGIAGLVSWKLRPALWKDHAP